MKNTDLLIFIISVLITLIIISMFVGCIKYNKKEPFKNNKKELKEKFQNKSYKIIKEKLTTGKPDKEIMDYMKSINFSQEDFDNIIKKLENEKKNN